MYRKEPPKPNDIPWLFGSLFTIKGFSHVKLFNMFNEWFLMVLLFNLEIGNESTLTLDDYIVVGFHRVVGLYLKKLWTLYGHILFDKLRDKVIHMYIHI